MNGGALLFTCLHAPLRQAAGPSPYVFGGVAGRGREEAVGAALNIQARCLRASKSYLFKLRDVRGAFTNVTHESVRQHLEAAQRSPEAGIHHNQHLNTVLRTPGGGDWGITKGTRQSDFGCDIFLGVYNIPLKKYVNSRQPTKEVMKLDGQNVGVSLLTFVDDLMDILIESTRDTANDKRLTQELRKVGCDLEPSKEESLLRWMGPNARKKLAKCRTRNLLVPGRFPQAVRHLGCWLEVGGGASTMIRQRIIAMRTSFYRYVGLWKSRHVSTRIKRMIFQAVINGVCRAGNRPG